MEDTKGKIGERNEEKERKEWRWSQGVFTVGHMEFIREFVSIEGTLKCIAISTVLSNCVTI